MDLSAEQRFIVTACTNGENVIVDAVAGSGKTTTLLGIAAASSISPILAILFNRSLKEETRIRAAHLPFLEVHNYHALARKYYDNTIQNDSGITKVINNGTKPIKSLPRWTRIIIDEVQDMNPLYYRLIVKVIRDLGNKELKLTIMGDRFQSIYSFLQADTRFLTHADQLHTTITGPWTRASLSTTYRCSKTICAFINESLIGYERLRPASNLEGHLVTYINGSPFDAHRYLFRQIQTFLYQGYKPDDIFILAPSVKVKLKDTPVKMLENALVNAEIPVYVPSEDEVDISHGAQGNPTQGKLVITTFHQSKGLERQIVIIYNFDDSYYKIFNRDADPNILSAELYVAMTRCKKHLFLVHDGKQPALRYFKDPSDEYVRFINTKGIDIEELPAISVDKTNEKPRNHIFKASEFTNYLTAEAILEARSHLTIQSISDPYTKIPLTSMIETAPKRFEIVSDLNGIAIPAIYEWRLRKHIRIAEEEKEGMKYSQRYNELRQQIGSAKEPNITTILEIANIFQAMDGYHYKVAQIKDYTWVTNAEIEPCMKILEDNLDEDDIQYEVSIPEQVCTNYTVMGRVDAFSQKKNTLWEIKCTDSLDASHEIQLAVYAWMFSRQFPQKFLNIEFHLLNIRTGECRQVSATKQKLDEMIAFLVAEKTRTPPKKTDEEFIREFTSKFDSTQPSLKQLTIPNMVQTVQQAMFLDDDELGLKPPSATKPAVKPLEPVKVKQIQTTLSPITSPTPTLTPTPRPDGRVIVFDLETTGLPITPSFGTYHPPQELDKYRQSRIVQWSWALYEPDGTLISEEDHIIKPNPVEYRIENSQFHGITEQIARVQGKDFATVLERWSAAVAQAPTIVGHNVNFDKHVLLSELYRRKHLDEALTIESKQWLCTMERAKELCALRAGNKLKPPKLIELMHALNVQEEPGRVFHNSKHDVYYTAKCYFAEQVLKNPCPKMYEGKYAGKTYDEILKLDRAYVVHAHAVCNVRKLYSSPLRKLSNWFKAIVAKDDTLKQEVKKREDEIRAMTDI
jgi:DNA polymerase III epsilon subunit-like protein